MNKDYVKRFIAAVAAEYGIPLKYLDPDVGSKVSSEADAAFLRLLDRVIYGTSFELDGVRIDPKRVVLHANGTYTLIEEKKTEEEQKRSFMEGHGFTPEEAVKMREMFPERPAPATLVWYNGAGGPQQGIVIQYAEGHIEICTTTGDVLRPGERIIVTEVFPSRLAALESKMPEMWPRWKDDETRSELGSTGIEVVQGHRDRYGDGWWVLDKSRGDAPSEKVVDWYRSRDNAKARAEGLYNDGMQKIQLDGRRMRRALGLSEETIEEYVQRTGERVEAERKGNPFYNAVLGVPFEVTDPCPSCGSQCAEVNHHWRCTNPKCNWRQE